MSRSGSELVLLFTSLLAITLAGQSCLDALLLAGLQVVGVSLDLLNDIFLLHLALETAERILNGLTLLQSDFRQLTTPPNSSRWTR